MGRTGILVDRLEQSRFKEKLEGEYQEAYERLQGEVPEAVRPRRRFKKAREGTRPVEVECPLCTKEVEV
jgi:hypothetical protein